MNQNEARQNPRTIVIQKLYGHQLNKDSEITFPKHRYKKFIRDVVNGTIERRELIQNLMDRELKEDINENKTVLRHGEKTATLRHCLEGVTARSGFDHDKV